MKKIAFIIITLLLCLKAYGQTIDKIDGLMIFGVYRTFDGGSLTVSFETNEKKSLKIELINRLKVDGKGKGYIEGGDKVSLEYIYQYKRHNLLSKSEEEKRILSLVRKMTSNLYGEERDYLELFGNMIETRSLDLKSQLTRKPVPKKWSY